MEHFNINTSNDYQVPVSLIRGNEGCNYVSIVLPALGMSAKRYWPFADKLAHLGGHVMVMEQRGHGRSQVRPSRQVDYGYKELVLDDIGALVTWCKQHLNCEYIYLVGHSLGGHLATCYAALKPTDIHGIVLVACGTPWSRAFKGKQRLSLNLLRLIIPVMTWIMGFYNGKKLGFGGKESRLLMKDWGNMISSNQYSMTGVNVDINKHIALFNGRVTSISFDQDTFAPHLAVKSIINKFSARPVAQHRLSSGQMGCRADHFSWLKAPQKVAEITNAEVSSLTQAVNDHIQYR